MKFIIIGLGNYGRRLAEELSALGHEIIGVDNNARHTNALKDKIAVSYILDVEQEDALTVLPLNSVDAVIVCIGENFGASIKVVALLKKLKVKTIFARAIDPVHRSILEAFNVSKILAPEEEAAQNLAHILDYGHTMDYLKLDDEYFIIRFTIPSKFANHTVNQLQLESTFKIKVIGLQHAKAAENLLGVQTTQFTTRTEPAGFDEKLAEGDKLICIGLHRNFQKMWNSL